MEKSQRLEHSGFLKFAARFYHKLRQRFDMNKVEDNQSNGMFGFSFRHPGGASGPREHPKSALRGEELALETREVLDEWMFRRVLRWERRRAERYQKFFMLMLVDAGQTLDTDEERVLPAIRAAVSHFTRETDLVGWYQKGVVLGVLFSEISQREKSLLENRMRAGVVGMLRAKLGAFQANQIGISFHFFPEGWDQRSGDTWADSKLYPDLLKHDDGKMISRLVKRAIDIAGSLMAIALFSPAYLVISVAIKLTSKGPVLFRQERVGQYGRRFTFLKFRSMNCANDAGIHRDYVKRFIAGEMGSGTGGPDKNVVFKITNDPRVTRIGRFLRKTSLDELPQFINVLRGEMSLVGPRPPIPYEMESYKVWHRRRVLDVKPGITGLWQVYGRSKTTFDEMVRLDLRYASTWSPWLDIKILLQTPRAVCFGEGAF